MRPLWNMVGWDTSDDYMSCSSKYIHFLRNFSLDEYDWVVFVDDDTFIVPRRLEPFLQTLDSDQSLYVGACCNDGWTYMSGGAGFAVSRHLMQRLQSYVRSKTDSDVHTEEYSDKTFGCWVHTIGDTEFLVRPEFHGDYSIDYASDCFSCHYVTEQGFYDLMRSTNSTGTEG